MKSDTVIAAISGGPDSMALLAYLENQKKSYVIAHINYKKRESAFRDEEIVRKWAEKYNRPLWIFYPQKSNSKNFQAWAREVRYTFFLKLAQLYQSQEIWLGHHMDDALETWMLQKKRQIFPIHYGLQEKVAYQGYTLVRPFLKVEFEGWRKQDFENFCHKNQIIYGIDESNLTSNYRRNQIRHEKIEVAPLSLRLKWIQAMKQENESLKVMHQRASDLVKENCFSKLQKDPLGWLALEKMIYEKTYRHHSKKEMEDLLRKLSKSGKQVLIGDLVENFKIKSLEVKWNIQVINDQVQLAKDFFIPIYIDTILQLQNLCKMNWSNSFFQFSNHGKNIESFFVTIQDFPLIIRPFQKEDCLAMRFGHKKVSRFLIDRKVAALFRPLYPVIQAKQRVIFASLAGADKEHYTKLEDQRFYMLQLPPI